MAKHVSNALLVILFALIATNANAQIPGINPIQLTVDGLLSCNLPGQLPSGLPLVGVNVTLSCNGGTTSLAQALTNPFGVFRLLVPAASIPTVLANIGSCRVFAILNPLLNCTVFPPNATLQSTLSVLSIVTGLIGSVFGFIVRIVALPFTLVTVA